MGNTIKKMAVVAFLVAMVVGLTGCASFTTWEDNGLACVNFGTYKSRIQIRDYENHFGKYPYQAVATDCIALPGLIFYPPIGLVGLISLPVDCAADTILLPVDLVLWPYGYKKSHEIGPSM